MLRVLGGGQALLGVNFELHERVVAARAYEHQFLFILRHRHPFDEGGFHDQAKQALRVADGLAGVALMAGLQTPDPRLDVTAICVDLVPLLLGHVEDEAILRHEGKRENEARRLPFHGMAKLTLGIAHIRPVDERVDV